MTVTTNLANVFAKAGLSVNRIGSRKRRLFNEYQINHVLDVGANSGQFAQGLRKHVGYAGEIISFEPLSAAFQALEAAARRDSKWKTLNCALGNEEGRLEINISENLVSSSFLQMLPECEAAAPHARYVSKETVSVHTLDSLYNSYGVTSGNVYLKIDTQGFEKQILDGAKDALPQIDTVELELSLAPLYNDQLLFSEMCEFMSQLGYSVVSIEPGFSDPSSGRMLQVDGVFHRY